MTDTNQTVHEELDAGWDDEHPAPVVSVRSQPPTPELEQLDAGWEHDHERSCPPRAASRITGAPISGVLSSSPAAARPAIDSIDEGWETEAAAISAPLGSAPLGSAPRPKGGSPTRKPNRKELRKLERQMRAHQAERGLENRELRKADRQELKKQRVLEQNARRELLRQQELVREQQKAAHRAERKKAKPRAAAAATPSRVPAQSAPSRVPAQSAPGAPNRAARRAKSGLAVSTTVANTTADSSVSAKRPLVGPFTLFIAVVLAASALSYLAIR